MINQLQNQNQNQKIYRSKEGNSMELKEIKTRYAGKCKKCDRDIKVGWTVFFDAITKDVYCKPCGEILKQKEEVLTSKDDTKTSRAMDLLESMDAQIVLQGNMLASMDDRFRDLQKDFNAHDNFVRKNLKPTTKKE